MMTNPFRIIANTFNKLPTFDYNGLRDIEKAVELEAASRMNKKRNRNNEESEHLNGIVTTADKCYFLGVDVIQNGDDNLKYVINTSAESPIVERKYSKKDFNDSSIKSQIKNIAVHIH